MKILFFISLFFAFLLSKLLLIQNQFTTHSAVTKDILEPIIIYSKHILDLLKLNEIPVYPIIKFNEHGFEHMVFMANVLLNYTPVFFIALLPIYVSIKVIKYLFK